MATTELDLISPVIRTHGWSKGNFTDHLTWLKRERNSHMHLVCGQVGVQTLWDEEPRSKPAFWTIVPGNWI